jgi:iron-sulfur cluster insertion protein
MVANVMSFDNKIDKNLIKIPKIEFSDRAFLELKLIIENDFTLAGKYFRIVISGKGCDGFTYTVGFTDLNEEDIMVPILDCKLQKTDQYIIVDPFAAFYLSEVKVDFIQDLKSEIEGFVVSNLNQKEFAGKFWKQNPEKTPPMVKGQVNA